MEWVLNPVITCEVVNLLSLISKGTKKTLLNLDLRNDLVFKSFFAEKELSEFWKSVESKFPQLSDKVLELLLSFGSSYLCELEFSALT